MLGIVERQRCELIAGAAVRAVGQRLVLFFESSGERAERDLRRIAAQEGLQGRACRGAVRAGRLSAEQKGMRAIIPSGDRERPGQALVGLLALLFPEAELDQGVREGGEVDRHRRDVLQPELAQLQLGQVEVLATLDDGQIPEERHRIPPFYR